MRTQSVAGPAKLAMIAAIIQARMASTRLPGKVLADIGGKPMIQRVIDRVKAAKLLDHVILATTVHETDAPLVDLSAALGVETFRGSVDDVLDRYYRAALFAKVDIVVRITGDCPLMDPPLIDRTVEGFLEGDCDYASTSYPAATFPDGLDIEVFPVEVLEQAWREASLSSEREHVTPYIWKNPELFRLKSIVNSCDLSAMRWTVDEENDLRFARQVFQHLDDGTGRIFGMNDVLDLLDLHPEIGRLNRRIGRNEGLQKSLREETQVSLTDSPQAVTRAGQDASEGS